MIEKKNGSVRKSLMHIGKEIEKIPLIREDRWEAHSTIPFVVAASRRRTVSTSTVDVAALTYLLSVRRD